ncbi:hypothetical protein BKA59DRAFT_471695 [Fusarium tricinctum]|uniref:Uncharacterized protein n=1 Tax=Fusarium tricinctum TaxID=61284 RepID=A0A8K0S3E8_9HYPO|nr:hypothetical protein BKA59DRAFT_471695 [Fusarium tricinctum]
MKVLVSLGVSGIIWVLALFVNKFATRRENKSQTASGSDAKGQTKPRIDASSKGTANTVEVNGGGVFCGGVFCGGLRCRPSRTKHEDPELGE